MPIRKCSVCNAEWTSSLSKCPLCGGTATELAGPTGKIVLKSAPKPEAPRPSPTTVDIAAELRQEFGGRTAIEAPPEPEPPPPREEVIIPPPVTAPVEKLMPGPVMTPAPPAPARPAPSPPGTLPLVLGLIALLACAILPLTLSYESRKIAGISIAKIGYAASGLLAMLAPLAWYLAQRRIDRGPRASTRIARVLGMIATFATVASFTAVMALQTISKWK